jgi:hypothetical protein
MLKAADEDHTSFTRECREALREYLTMRAQGVPRDLAIKGLEAILREHLRPRVYGRDHRAVAARNDA